MNAVITVKATIYYRTEKEISPEHLGNILDCLDSDYLTDAADAGVSIADVEREDVDAGDVEIYVDGKPVWGDGENYWAPEAKGEG